MKLKLLPMMLVPLFTSYHVFADEKTPQVIQSVGECGIITIYNKPPKTKNIHFASINSIDGETVSSNNRTFVLSPGKHIIKVIENIRENSLTRRRGEMKNYKFIEVDIQPNKKYSLGAKFIRKNRSKLKTGEYWQPVVWKQTDESCTIK